MPTGTASLRKTERRGGVLVAACAAALAAALAGPAWAGPVPTPDDPPAGPRGEASPQIAEAPTKASSPEARTTPAAGTEASTPTPDAPLAAQTTHATPKANAHTAAAKTSKVTTPAPTSTATPQPAPTYGSTTIVSTATARTCRRLCAPGGPAKAETASRPTGERNEAGFAGARGCRGPAGRQPPRPADRDAHALVRRLRPGSDRNARSRGAPARGRGRGRPRRGRRRPPSRSDRVSPMRILGLALVAMVGWAVAPAAGGAASTPVPACNGGGCGGWFRSNVTVTWSYDGAGVTSAPGCGATTVTDDTGGATLHLHRLCGHGVLREQRDGSQGLEPAFGRIVVRQGPGLERLVHEPGRSVVLRRRRTVRDQLLHLGHVQRAGQRRREGDGVVHGRGGQHRARRRSRSTTTARPRP